MALVVSRLGESKSCEAVATSKECSSSDNIVRQPRGPDGTKGFAVTRWWHQQVSLAACWTLSCRSVCICDLFVASCVPVS